MQVVFSGLRLPADEGIAGFDFPGGRAPAQTGHGPLIDKGDVLEMIALRGVGSLCLYDKMRKMVSFEVKPHLC